MTTPRAPSTAAILASLLAISGAFPAPVATPQDADPVAVHNAAVEELARGNLREAEALARDLVARDDPYTLPHAHALLGFVALRRAEQAHAQASGPEAEPFAMDAAIDAGERARDEWVTAIARMRQLQGADLPACRRNVERLMTTLARWREERDANRPEALREQDQAKVNPKLIPRSSEQPDAGKKPEEERAGGQDDPEALDAQGVQRYLELLEQKRADRLELRAASRREASRTVEKDW